MKIRLTVVCACCTLLALLFCGCSETVLRTEDDYLDKARQVIPLAEADNIELRCAAVFEQNEKALIWIIGNSEQQTHSCFALECAVGDEGYIFERCLEPLMRAQDIAVVPWWQNGYVFFVNNGNCTAIHIEPLGGEDFTVGVGALPFLYFYDGSTDFSYTFTDETGAALPEI